MKKNIWFMAWMIAAVALLAAGARGAEVRIAPAPAGEPLSTSYTVTVEQRNVPVYLFKVASANPVLRNKAMDDLNIPDRDLELASFASFDMQGTVKVTVTCPVAVQSAKVLPSSCGIAPEIAGQTVTFTWTQPRNIVLEINGNWVNSLQVFANPFETDVPSPQDPKVIYYGPGIHELESLRVTTGQTLYLAAGAVVRGKVGPGRRGNSVVALEGDNIVVRGRGILDGGLCPIHTKNMITVRGNNIRLEGIIVRDSSTWNIPIRRSEGVKVQNIKVLGHPANSDGIDICNSRNVEVTGCFLRTLDDLVVIKSDKGQGVVSNVTVTGCVLWNEVAHALSIGAELRDEVSQVHFADCDVIHDKGREWTLRVYHCDSARIHDILFENIRIEETRKLISLWIGSAVWSREPERGHIDNVTFRNIQAAGTRPRVELTGFDAGHLVSDTLLDRVTVNGQSLQASAVIQNGFVKGVTVQP